MKLSKFSIGTGDRFSLQGEAQLTAIMKAKKLGIEITPVWNKSFREHEIIKSRPESTRQEADAAVIALGWTGQYFVDADHVGLKNVDFFTSSSDFFTIDVADSIGVKADPDKLNLFIKKCEKYIGRLKIPEIEDSFNISRELVQKIAAKFLHAIEEAGKIYHHILQQKNQQDIVIEISMDETNEPQTPVEMFFILKMIADVGIPVQTIAPKFTGRFNKGVDYVGNLEQFTKEFEQDVNVVNFAIKEFSLPANLKLSVHSGSDKFSIYEPIKKTLKKYNAGIHLKTAGTTWLEELIGLAEAGGDALSIPKAIYKQAYNRFDELCKPYATVIDIASRQLPLPKEVDQWSGAKFAATLRHDQDCDEYNPDFRQLLHVAYKVAAEMGAQFTNAVKKHKDIIGKNVTENLFERHIKRIFI